MHVKFWIMYPTIPSWFALSKRDNLLLLILSIVLILLILLLHLYFNAENKNEIIIMYTQNCILSNIFMTCKYLYKPLNKYLGGSYILIWKICNIRMQIEILERWSNLVFRRSWCVSFSKMLLNILTFYYIPTPFQNAS